MRERRKSSKFSPVSIIQGLNSEALEDLENSAGDHGAAREVTLWIFGYGSLIWFPGFEYCEAKKCKLTGWARRMWQGNTTYRGTELLPGRVATIVQDSSAETFGLVYKITGLGKILAALDHLHCREIESGYVYEGLNVQCLDEKLEVMALTVVAGPKNTYFLGEQDLSVAEMAWQIAKARGAGGPNSEYVFKLADAMRKHFPGVADPHLFELEAHIMTYMRFCA